MDKAKLQKQLKQRDKKRREVPFGGHGGSGFRPQSGGIPYNPARDFAFNYPLMIRSVVLAFNREHWPELLEFVTETYPSKDVNEAFDDLEAAKDAYTDFCGKICDDTGEDVAGTLDRATDRKGVSWYDLPIAARIGFLAMLGEVVTGQIWAGVRDVTLEGGMNREIADLLEAGQQSRMAMEGLTEKEDAIVSFRDAVRLARKAGMPFSDIRELVKDVELGRV